MGMNDKTKATEFECPKCGSIHYTGKLGRQFRIPDGGASRAEAPTQPACPTCHKPHAQTMVEACNINCSDPWHGGAAEAPKPDLLVPCAMCHGVDGRCPYCQGEGCCPNDPRLAAAPSDEQRIAKLEKALRDIGTYATKRGEEWPCLEMTTVQEMVAAYLTTPSSGCSEAPSDEQIEKEGALRDVPEDFWQWSMELQRGWLWKRCLALQQLADLAGGAVLNLVRKQEGSNG